MISEKSVMQFFNNKLLRFKYTRRIYERNFVYCVFAIFFLLTKIVKEFFGEQFQKSYQVVKEHEINRFESTVTDFEYNSYLRHL